MFIVRGDRVETVRRSSRSSVSRRFALARIAAYELVLVSMTRRGRSEVWLQGDARMHRLSARLGKRSSAMYELNAVLRELGSEHQSAQTAPASGLVYVGRLTIEKGLIELAEAFEALTDDYPDLTLSVLGDGPDRARIEEAFAAGICSGRVTFLGHVSDADAVASQLRAAAVLVLPSYTEGLPRSVIEAMYAETLVVASAVGGIPAVIEHDVSGFLCEPGSAASLESSLRTALGCDVDQAQSIRAEARRRATEYSFDVRGRHFLDHVSSAKRLR